MVFTALSQLPLTIIVATAGRIAFAHATANIFIADYVPLDIGSRRSLLVISNGGSLTTCQALASQVHVTGVSLCKYAETIRRLFNKTGQGVDLLALQNHRLGKRLCLLTAARSKTHAS
jgi:hypothetical protein